MPSTLAGVVRDDPDADVHRGHVVVAAEIARERRVEHLAQPVDDAGLAQLGEDPVVDRDVVVRRARAGGKRATGHEDDPPAQPLDRRDLLFVGADHVVGGEPRRRRQVIGAGAAEDHGALARPSRFEAAADQLVRGVPVEPHAALRRVHGLGHPEPQVPQVLAIRDRALPVDRDVQPRIDVGERVGDHMRGGKRHPVEGTARLLRKRSRLAHAISGEMADRGRQLDRRHGVTRSPRSHPP